MRWRRGQAGRSSDVIDARRGGLGGGGLSMGRGITIPGGVGLAGVIVYLLIQVLAGGGSAGAYGVDNPFGQAPQAPAADGRGIPAAQDPERDLKEFSGYVFSRTLNTWEGLFADERRSFERAHVVLYRDAVATGCGNASSAVGPFYCPADQTVYIDLSFYDELRTRFGAHGGAFAEAYVIAHEYGHHVQHLLGTDKRVGDDRQGERSGSVRLELQADCYAGVWAAHAVDTGFIEDLTQADITDGLDAAAAVGDDRIQKAATGRVDKESWTHGSAAERQRWFQTGDRGGDARRCDTFAPGAL